MEALQSTTDTVLERPMSQVSIHDAIPTDQSIEHANGNGDGNDNYNDSSTMPSANELRLAKRIKQLEQERDEALVSFPPVGM